jgi:hypothetical protein
MYENATTLKLVPGVMEKALSVLREQILPLIKNQDGLIHIGLVPDPFNNNLTVISVWACAKDAAAVEKKCAYIRALEWLDPYLQTAPDQPGEALNPLRQLSPKIPLN